MKAVLILALFVAAATCTNNVTVMYEHLNLYYKHLGDAIEARNKKCIFGVISHTVKAISNLVVYEQDFLDTLPTLVEYFDNLGLQTAPCYNNFQNLKSIGKEIITRVKSHRLSGLLNLAINFLEAARDTNATCINTVQVIASRFNTSCPICGRAKQEFRNLALSFQNLSHADAVRNQGRLHVEAFKVLVACAPGKAKVRYFLAEAEETAANKRQRDISQRILKRNGQINLAEDTAANKRQRDISQRILKRNGQINLAEETAANRKFREISQRILKKNGQINLAEDTAANKRQREISERILRKNGQLTSKPETKTNKFRDVFQKIVKKRQGSN